MIANFKTQLASTQQWLTNRVQLWQGDQGLIEQERARQAAVEALNTAERACISLDYLHSADHLIGSLRAAQEALTESLNENDPKDNHFKDWHILARLHEQLGAYSQAQECYTRAHSLLPPRHHSHTHILRDLARFLSETGHNLDLAEQVCRSTLLSGSDEGRQVASINSAVLASSEARGSEGICGLSAVLDDVETLSLVLCLKERFEEALKYINQARKPYIRNKQPSISTRLALCRALTFTGLRKKEQAETEFLRALVLSALNLGNWHLKTLRMLYAYAMMLRNWGRHADAASLFTECYIGSFYRLGPHHINTEETYVMIKQCTLTQHQRNTVRIFRACPTYAKLRTIAYEHMELWTIADTLESLECNPFAFAEKFIGYLLEHPSIHLMQQTRLESTAKKIIRFRRAMAACESRLGKHAEAASRLKLLLQSPGAFRINNTMILQCKLDSAIYLSQASKRGTNDPKVQDLSQFVFYESETLLESYKEERCPLISALRRRLAQHNLTHFEWGNLPELDALPFKFIEVVGNGNCSASVNSVSMKGTRYAQKITVIKGIYARQLKAQTKKEVDVLRRLHHPHIVQVHCTFEGKHSFAIIMQPLASGDLEAFLSQTTLPLELSPLIEKWLGCLVVTLSFIHDHGIKHRDIKPKNILFKDELILFSDFGSSRDCSLETGMSTDGPAYGHTKIYGAPEVIAEERRNASADIFSLGCVFTEMISVLCGRSLSCYDHFRGSKEYRRVPYYATLDLVEAWFMDEEQMPAWGAKMYTAFIKPMLSQSVESRPSAQETALAIQTHFQSEKLATETFCQYCFQYCLTEI